MDEKTEITNSERSLKENKPNHFLSFLNSPLGLWLLSSIFIGLITFSYQSWSHSTQLAHERTTHINNLKTEINRRIFIFNKEIEMLSRFDSMDTIAKDVEEYPQKIERAVRKVNSKNCYVFEEFKKRKLSTLLFELSSLLTDENRMMALEAFENMFLIEQFPSQINKETSIESADKYFEKILSYTKTSLSTEKWKSN